MVQAIRHLMKNISMETKEKQINDWSKL
jgi:hypothetical protein